MTSRCLAASILVLGGLVAGTWQGVLAAAISPNEMAMQGTLTGANATIGGHVIPSFNVKITTSISKTAVSFTGTKVTLTGPIDGTITADNTVPDGTIEKTRLKFAGTIGGKNVTLTGDVTGAIDGSHLNIQGTLAGHVASPPSISLMDKFFKSNGLMLRQSVFDKTELQQPAAFQWVKPSGGGSSYAIDAGLTWNVMNYLERTTNFDELVSHVMLGPSVEYHRNTQIKSLQDTFEAGLTALYVGGGYRYDEVGYYLQATGQYKDDRINTGKGAQVLLSGAPICQALAMGGVANAAKWDPGWLQWTWQPIVGLQYASADNVFKTNQSGEVGRLKGNVALGVYPWGKMLDQQIEGDVRETYWYDEAQEGAYDGHGRGQNLFEATGTFWFDVAQNAGLGIDYMRGENPEQGFSRQETVTLSLKAKF
jgi:hypothetical protein